MYFARAHPWDLLFGSWSVGVGLTVIAGIGVGVLILDPQAGIEMTIAVAAAKRRAGIGTALLRFARARALTYAGPLLALVDGRNVAACEFFRHHGFKTRETESDGLLHFEDQ